MTRRSKMLDGLFGFSRTVTTLLCLLLIVALAQGIIMQITYKAMQRSTKKWVAKPATAPAWSEEEKLQRKIATASQEFLPDGTAHFVVTKNRSAKNKPVEVEVYDARNTLVWQGQRGDLPYRYLTPLKEVQNYHFTAFDLFRVQRLAGQFSSTLCFSVKERNPRANSDNLIVREWWTYNPSTGQFIGTDVSGKPLGYMGPSGVDSSSSHAGYFERFVAGAAWYDDGGQIPLLWQTRDKVYEIDFARRRCQLLVDTGDDPIQFAQTNEWVDSSGRRNPLTLVVHTEGRKVHIMRGDPVQSVSFEMPQELKQRGLRISVADEGIFVSYLNWEGWDEFPKGPSREAYVQWWTNYRSRPYKMWTELYCLEESGKLALVNKVEWTHPADPPLRDFYKYNETGSAVAARAFSPGAYGFIRDPKALRWYESQKQAGGDYWSQAVQVAFWFVEELSPVDRYAHWILSLALACIAVWHQWPRRTSWVRLIGWGALVLLFNLPGLLTYWAMNHVPVVRCAACGRKRGLNRPDCRACGASLPSQQPRQPNLITI